MGGDPNDLRVEVHGGSSADRQLLGTSITALLKKEGFKSVSGFSESNDPITPNRMMKKTVADIVQQSRPDLFEKKISVNVMKAQVLDTARLRLSAEGASGVSVVDTRGDTKQFLDMAEDYGAIQDITVASTSAAKVGEAVGELLRFNPELTIKAKIRENLGPSNMVMGQF